MKACDNLWVGCWRQWWRRCFAKEQNHERRIQSEGESCHILNRFANESLIVVILKIPRMHSPAPFDLIPSYAESLSSMEKSPSGWREWLFRDLFQIVISECLFGHLTFLGKAHVS